MCTHVSVHVEPAHRPASGVMPTPLVFRGRVLNFSWNEIWLGWLARTQGFSHLFLPNKGTAYVYCHTCLFYMGFGD